MGKNILVIENELGGVDAMLISPEDHKKQERCKCKQCLCKNLREYFAREHTCVSCEFGDHSI